MANYVIQSGDGRRLGALDVLLSGLLATTEGRAEKATPPAGQ
jgi:hypothetical protein